LDAVYSTSNPLHLSALLKAVRTTYNIFLLSRNNDNQNVAQITMTQMVDHIFRRVKLNPNARQPTPAEATAENEVVTAEPVDVVQENSSTLNEENTPNTNVPNAPLETDEESNAYQQQIIVEANMARTEMDHRLPSGRSRDNYEDFLNDTANVFQEQATPASTSTAPTNHPTITAPADETT
jgi:brefeldin A-inhibited guanine nucleotide-exchange protein